MADLKKCPNCGRIYPGRYKFCPECGADLRTAGASPRPTEEEGKSDLISREAALAILHECGGDEITPPNMIEMRGRMYKILAVDAVEVSADELKHLINDTIAYIWRMEDSGRNKPEFGYDSRKELLKKLKQFEIEHFPEMACSCGKRREENAAD